ncbi:hypothetical protein DFH28DRAFT_1128684 [Melampsora americana]|nr:hypothetical protein DFH28DRAFT_1128684 [Melampsora americana]
MPGMTVKKIQEEGRLVVQNNGENHLDLNSIFHSGNGQALEHIHNMGIQSTKYIPGNELNAYDTTSISNPLHSADSFNEYFREYNPQGGEYGHAVIPQGVPRRGGLFQRDPMASDHFIMPGMTVKKIQEEGRLVVQNNGHLYQKMHTAFETYHENLFKILQTGPAVSHHEMQFMIQQFETDIVFPFMGAIHAIFQVKPNIPKMELLLDDGWEFLNGNLMNEVSSLIEKLSNQANHYSSLQSQWPSQGSLLGNFLKPQNDIPMIQELLIKWSENTIYTPDQYGINIKKIVTSHQWENTGTETREIQINTNIPENLSIQEKINLLSIVPEGDIPRVKISGLLYLFLKTIGTNILQIETSLASQVKQFFKDLHSGISMDPHGKLFSNQIFNRETVEHILRNSISRAENKITPIFMSLLWIMHEKKKLNQTWEKISESGWEFLKHHFSLWKEIFKDQEELEKSQRMYKSNRNKWYNAEHELFFFAINSENRRLSMKPAWRLVDLWLQSFTGNQGSSTNIKMIASEVHHNQLMRYKKYIARRPGAVNRGIGKKRKTWSSLRLMEGQNKLSPSISNKFVRISPVQKPFKPSKGDPQFYSSKLPRFLVRFGRDKIDEEKNLLKEIAEYSAILEAKMLQRLESAKEISLKPSMATPTAAFMNDSQVSRAIEIFKEDVMPAFIAASTLTHHVHVSPDALKPLLWSGWRYLRNYLSQWETLFLDHPSTIFSSMQRLPRNSIDWHNPQDAFQYMLIHNRNDDVPLGFVLYLTQQWYMSVTDKDVNTPGLSGFKLSPPNWDELRKIHKSFLDKQKTEASKMTV